MPDFDPHTELIETLKEATDSDDNKIFAEVFNDSMQDPDFGDGPLAQVLYASGSFEYRGTGSAYMLVTRVAVTILLPSGKDDADMTQTRNDMLRYIYNQPSRSIWDPVNFIRIRHTGDEDQVLSETIIMKYTQDILSYT